MGFDIRVVVWFYHVRVPFVVVATFDLEYENFGAFGAGRAM